MIQAPPRTDPLTEAARSFQLHLRASNKSEHTITSYTNSIDGYRGFAQEHCLPLTLQDITRGHIESYLASLRDKGQRPGTIFTRYMGLHALFTWLVREGDIPDDPGSPMRSMKAPKIPENDVVTLSESDIRAILKICDGRAFVDRRDTAILRLLIDSGLRRHEVSGLWHRNPHYGDRSDVDFDRQELRVIRKGGKVRAVPFGSKTALALDRYLRARSEHQHSDYPQLWLSTGNVPLSDHGLYLMVRRRADQAKLNGVHPHLFRHTWACLWSDNEGDILDLKQLGGWSDLKIVERYNKHTQQERARKAHRRLSIADRF